MSGLNRRQLLKSSGVGALLGAAWGAGFLEAELASNHPTIIIYRTPELFSMLIEYGSSRLLMLHGDGDDEDALWEAAHSTTGFLRHRLDIVLASDAILQTLPASFIDRWNISTIYALPDKPRPFSNSLEGRQIVIGDLAVSCLRVPFGEWKTMTSVSAYSWYVEIAYGSTRCIYGSNWDVLEQIVPLSQEGVTLSITNEATERTAISAPLGVVAAPAEALALLRQAGSMPVGVHLVRLYRDFPISIELRHQAVITPDDTQFL